MKKILAAALLPLAALAHAGQAAEQVNGYFDHWLKQHRFTAYEKRADGIWFTAGGLHLDGEVNQVSELRPGQFYSVESRVSLTFPDGRRLDDFVSGAGNTATLAFQDSLLNLCETTLEPLYAELFDHDDANVRRAAWTIAGAPRRVFLSPWGQRGEKVDAATQAAVERLVAQALAREPLSDELHWLKVVVLVTKGKLDTVAVTIDGRDAPALIDDLRRYPWPHPKTFSIAKLFVVVGKR